MNSRRENRINLLFAGKVLDKSKTLAECKIENNYVIHAIFKKKIQQSQPVHQEEAPENEHRRCNFLPNLELDFRSYL